jgi:hypothetical protein
MNELPYHLLAADEPVHNENGPSPFLIVADHAGNSMPRTLGRLGLSETECEQHVAWDIGIARFPALWRTRSTPPWFSRTCSMRARRKNSRNDAEVRVGCRPASRGCLLAEGGVDWQPKRTGLRCSTADADDHGSSPPISPGTRTVWNAGSHPRLASGLPASSENAYHPHQFGIHPGNR